MPITNANLFYGNIMTTSLKINDEYIRNVVSIVMKHNAIPANMSSYEIVLDIKQRLINAIEDYSQVLNEGQFISMELNLGIFALISKKSNDISVSLLVDPVVLTKPSLVCGNTKSIHKVDRVLEKAPEKSIHVRSYNQATGQPQTCGGTTVVYYVVNDWIFWNKATCHSREHYVKKIGNAIASDRLHDNANVFVGSIEDFYDYVWVKFQPESK